MSQQRPTADALLARIQEQDRARLRIYIGAAPGVGKAYEMLQEAHALRARGLDVVIGYVETYGRRETDAQIRDLEMTSETLRHHAPDLIGSAPFARRQRHRLCRRSRGGVYRVPSRIGR
jgi:K+-sensing histidine kinase KdpD